MTRHTTNLQRPESLQRALSVDDDVELSISEVCALLGINAHTARYYERAGLLEVPRSHSGHRIYDRSPRLPRSHADLRDGYQRTPSICRSGPRLRGDDRAASADHARPARAHRLPTSRAGTGPPHN
ncbi:MerR family DNA-binding transcriptional regulator [Brevibacterium antiquum]|uniref:MerR family DNA-binding transcriptional regulator n=1 Tax=Brevibacterium antiquum TaxID=234835 RepID=UPI0018DF4233